MVSKDFPLEYTEGLCVVLQQAWSSNSWAIDAEPSRCPACVVKTRYVDVAAAVEKAVASAKADAAAQRSRMAESARRSRSEVGAEQDARLAQLRMEHQAQVERMKADAQQVQILIGCWLTTCADHKLTPRPNNNLRAFRLFP